MRLEIRVAASNVNNLFSRFSFRARIEAPLSEAEGGLTLTFGSENVRTFMGNLVKGKGFRATEEMAERIREHVNADIPAMKEVEHIEILKEFNGKDLQGLNPLAV